jgi:Arc/MetJ-type ribon-helix-helix transcriptional regulator
MNLTLSRQAEERIAEQVRSGRFPTPEAVVEAAIAGLTERPSEAPLVEHELNADDVLALNEAEDEIDRGEGIDLATLRERMAARSARR